MKTIWKRIILVGCALVVVALIVWALRPAPTKVEVARAGLGPLRETIDAEGKTRVHDRFVIAAPVTGRMKRITLHRGDTVESGTLITQIEPPPLQPLDPRQLAEANAHVAASQSALREAESVVERVRAECDQAQRDRERAERLLESGDVSRQEFERLRSAETGCRKQLDAARFRSRAAASEVEAAKAALIAFEQQRQNISSKPVPVTAPIRGRVLRLIEESERVVTMGSPLIELSNPSNLEIVIDVLSTDAVKIKPGTPVMIENWGGEQPLRAQIRSVEPSAFTKVSALGVEEQRVNVIADFLDLPEALGDGYRVEAKIVLWESDKVLQVPLGALFRKGDNWSVFVVENGLAHSREIRIGHRSPLAAEILQGLSEGTVVILHPGNEITDGMRVKER